MSNIKSFVVVAVVALLAGAAYAAPGRVGGGGGFHGGGGGAPHPMGGGGAHFGGGGGMHVGGAPHFGGGGMRLGGAPHLGGGPHFGGMHVGGAPHFGGGGMRFGGAHHFGGGPHFGGRPAISHFAARPNFRAQRSFGAHGNRFAGRGSIQSGNRNVRAGGNRNALALAPNRNVTARTNAVRNALHSRAVAGALHNPAMLRNPNARARIAASAATAGWREGHHGGGWWRHRHGGYGWVGPLFWPFAYYDIYDYTLWGYGYDDPFWDYGYGDIYAGVFYPYGYDDLAGYSPQQGGGRTEGKQAPTSDELAQMCSEDNRDIAGVPIDQIRSALALNDAQRAALDDLANVSAKAADQIKATCPTQNALTAPARLAAMQQRLEAMISAVEIVQPPLQKFYDLLNDDQKAKLNALGQDERRAETAKNKRGTPTESCGAAQANAEAWPASEIEARVHPTEAQRVSLKALQDATAKAADILKTSCQPNQAITPPARLEAAHKRLDVMLEAVKTVRAPLDDFYGKLSDEQKAQFEAIGQRRSASSDQSSATPRHFHHHHYHASIGGMVRRIISMIR
jgi:LTXXQ motif family protein